MHLTSTGIPEKRLTILNTFNCFESKENTFSYCNKIRKVRKNRSFHEVKWFHQINNIPNNLVFP